MAEFPLTDAYVEINSVDLSDHVRSLSLPLGVERLDDTAMGDTARSAAAGLNVHALTVEFNQDFAASKVDQTIAGIVGTVVAIEVRPDSAAASATNPKWTGNMLVADYNPIAGSVGDQAIATVELVSDGSGLTRGTS